MFKVITAPEYEPEHNSLNDTPEIKVFLAGGITNCHNWQDEVIEQLKFYKPAYMTIYNPRRPDFPIDDPRAAEEQISWEFDHLEKCDIFAMYFCGGPSDQPICMYELGRNMYRIKEDCPRTYKNRMVIGVENGYKRAKDVCIQTRLALGEAGAAEILNLDINPFMFAKHIIQRYNYQIIIEAMKYDNEMKKRGIQKAVPIV